MINVLDFLNTKSIKEIIELSKFGPCPNCSEADYTVMSFRHARCNCCDKEIAIYWASPNKATIYNYERIKELYGEFIFVDNPVIYRLINGAD